VKNLGTLDIEEAKYIIERLSPHELEAARSDVLRMENARRENVKRASKWNKENPERNRASSLRWSRANPEKNRQKSQRWYAANREAILERQRARRRKAREALKGVRI